MDVIRRNAKLYLNSGFGAENKLLWTMKEEKSN